MTNESIPEDDFWAELEEMAKNLAKGSESYIPRLQIISDNMNEGKSYYGAKGDLLEYIQLLTLVNQGGTRTADESDKMQALGKKLRGVVIPESVYAGSNLPTQSGDVIIFSKERTKTLLEGDGK